MVFGGFQYEPDNDKFKMLKSEKCTLSNSRFFCKQQKPLLSANHYPELFLVEHDFCKIKPWLKVMTKYIFIKNFTILLKFDHRLIDHRSGYCIEGGRPISRKCACYRGRV